MFNPLILLNTQSGTGLQERLTFFGRLYGLDTNPEAGMWYFITIFVLCAIVYQLGFARKVKLWQTLVIFNDVYRCNIPDIFWCILSCCRVFNCYCNYSRRLQI